MNEFTIDSTEILPNGNLSVTYTMDSVQYTKEVEKSKICNIVCGVAMEKPIQE